MICGQELKNICQQEKLQFIDIYNVFDKQSNYKELLFDGLHPNAKGHELIFEIIKKELNF